MQNDIPDLIKEYCLQPYSIRVQAIVRTFIDKIFALCDYYMEANPTQHSRHLYDLYMLYPNIILDKDFITLFQQVREQRSHLLICPSADESVNLPEMILKITRTAYYKKDYESTTINLISNNVSYEQAAECFQNIGLFLRKLDL